jgi:outer membrane protein OmpA-like peptidoglycan-associated protein
MRPVWAGLVLLLVALCAFPVQARSKRLSIQVAAGDVNLDTRTITFRLNKPARDATVTLYSPEGQVLGENTKVYGKNSPGARLSIQWPAIRGRNTNFKLELRVYDTEKFWVQFEIVRFYLEIPHVDVVFETNEWQIRSAEVPKLDAALMLFRDAVAKYGGLVQCKIYVAGFTDTVGEIPHNRVLSLKRARAIARYFIRGGLTRIPIFVRGFGEELLKAPTGDEISEEKNRRAVYIISTYPPELPGPGAWEQIQ